MVSVNHGSGFGDHPVGIHETDVLEEGGVFEERLGDRLVDGEVVHTHGLGVGRAADLRRRLVPRRYPDARDRFGEGGVVDLGGFLLHRGVREELNPGDTARRVRGHDHECLFGLVTLA